MFLQYPRSSISYDRGNDFHLANFNRNIVASFDHESNEGVISYPGSTEANKEASLRKAFSNERNQKAYSKFMNYFQALNLEER